MAPNVNVLVFIYSYSEIKVLNRIYSDKKKLVEYNLFFVSYKTITIYFV